MAAIGAPIDVGRLVGELTVAEEQMVQIAAAVGSGARVIVFDEPTSCLSQPEAEHLFALVERLRARGVTCVYVSHRMEEIFRLCDTITVLRDGRHVATSRAAALDEVQLVQLMIGRRLEQYLPRDGASPGRRDAARRRAGQPAQVRGHVVPDRAGEVVGIAGLVGAGRSDIARRSSDWIPRRPGGSRSTGVALRLRSPRRRCARGSAWFPRIASGRAWCWDARARQRDAADAAPARARRLVMRAGAERALAADAFARLRVRPPCSTRRRPACPAATSRRSRWRSGWRRAAAC